MLRQGSSHYARAFSDFRAQLGQCTQTAVCGRNFVRITKLKEWLQSDSPIPGKSHLELLLPKDPVSPQPLVTGDMLIARNALVTFSILLQLEHTEHIEIFLDAGFVDARLPINLSELRTDLQEAQIADAENVSRSFAREQWRFCPAVFELDAMERYRQERILPIVRHSIINNKGGTAKLWKIEVLEEFVGESLRPLVARSKFKVNDGLGVRYRFALKCFEGPSKERFDHEKGAFANLRNYNGVVKCLANYAYRDSKKNWSWNLLLEYGDSDLDIYFVHHHPPFLEQEVVGFWKELFEVFKALEAIHNPKNTHDGKKYKGWHADVKPANILFINGKFKLADPGFVKFVQNNIEDPTAVLEGCTWTYSAPEHRPGRKIQVSQKIDIWSFGCVFSIAATWVTGGYSAVRDFIKIRRKAVDTVLARRGPSADIPPGDLFHDGSRVLEDVTEWHRVLRNQARRTDRITEQVLDLVDECMLIEHPEKRLDSRKLCDKLDTILKKCQPDQSNLMKPSLRDALLEIDKEASETPTITLSSTSNQELTDSTGNAEDRIQRKLKMLDIPMKKTALRSEFLTSLPPAPTSDSPTHGLHRRSESVRMPKAPPPTPHRKRSEAPHKAQNYYQVRNELRRRKDSTKLPWPKSKDKIDATLAKYFINRDIKFLIDNGSTMSEHWDQADILLELLVEKAAGVDKNGIDACFTCGNVKLKDEKVLKEFHKAMWREEVIPQPHVLTDMKAALGRVFAEHMHYLRTHPGRKKHLTLIIFTDGLWKGTSNPDDVTDKVANFIRAVTKQLGTLEERPVSLQFVQFGHNRDATFRLQWMDDELRYEVDDVDVIDTESADGDVNKIFLGSFVETYDILENPVISPLEGTLSPSHAPT